MANGKVYVGARPTARARRLAASPRGLYLRARIGVHRVLKTLGGSIAASTATGRTVKRLYQRRRQLETFPRPKRRR